VNNPITASREPTATDEVEEGCFREPHQEEGKEQESAQAGNGQTAGFICCMNARTNDLNIINDNKIYAIVI